MTISTWAPVRQTITGITNANPAVVTTEDDHGYLAGIFVRIQLPGNFGMSQLDDQVFPATILSDTTFSIGVDTTGFDAFTTAGQSQSPQCIPVGETALTLANLERNTLTPFGGASP